MHMMKWVSTCEFLGLGIETFVTFRVVYLQSNYIHSIACLLMHGLNLNQSSVAHSGHEQRSIWTFRRNYQFFFDYYWAAVGSGWNQSWRCNLKIGEGRLWTFMNWLDNFNHLLQASTAFSKKEERSMISVILNLISYQRSLLMEDDFLICLNIICINWNVWFKWSILFKGHYDEQLNKNVIRDQESSH